MTTDQTPKLEITRSQHPVDAIVRAIVAGAEFARRTFDQTKDYEMPPDKEDRENFRSSLRVIETCITETERLHNEGLLEGWENRNGKPGIVMTTHFDVDPRADPGKIAKVFEDLEENPTGVQGGSGRPASDTLDEERR